MADCSEKPGKLKKKFTVPARNWINYKLSKGVRYEIEVITGGKEMNIYSKDGEIPTVNSWDNSWMVPRKGGISDTPSSKYFVITKSRKKSNYLSFFNPNEEEVEV